MVLVQQVIYNLKTLVVTLFNSIKKLFKFKIITKYVLKEFLFTFLITFLFFFIIFFINSILLIISPLLEKKMPTDLVIGLLVTTFPINTIFSLPFGVLLATLMVMGRFSSDNEIVGFRACGFSYSQIFKPIFIVSIIVCVITFIVYDRLVPASMEENYRLRQKIFEIKPTIGFKSNTIRRYEKMIIYTKIVEDTKIKGLIIMDEDENNNKRIITAETADILNPPEREGVIELKLKNSMIQIENRDRPNEFNYGYVDEMSYFISFYEFQDSSLSIKNIELPTLENIKEVKKFKISYNEEKKSRLKNYILTKENMMNLLRTSQQYLTGNISINQIRNNFYMIDGTLNNLKEMKNSLSYKSIQDANLNRSLIKLYQKFTHPIACIVFALFAAPIGIYSRRAGFSIGFIVGLFLSAFYWFSFYGLILLSFKFVLPPFIANFLPDFIFLFIGLIFLIKRFKE